MSRDRDTLHYRHLARSEARFNLKERLLEQMILSVDDLDDFHVSFMLKIKHRGTFNNLLYPSDIQEIEQAIEHRKQQWNQLEKVFYVMTTYKPSHLKAWITFLFKRYIIMFEPEENVRSAT